MEIVKGFCPEFGRALSVLLSGFGGVLGGSGGVLSGFLVLVKKFSFVMALQVCLRRLLGLKIFLSAFPTTSGLPG